MPLDIGGGVGAPPETSETNDRIAKVEKSSGGTLPSQMTLTLSQSSVDDRRLERAARMLARYFDLPPAWFLQRYHPTPDAVEAHEFTDPVTGEEITLATARRFIRPHEAEVVQRMLDEAMPEGEVALRRRFGVAEGTITDSKRVTQAVRALAPLAGERMPFGAAMAIAIAVGSGRTDIETFASNVQLTANLEGLSPALAAEIAKRGADQGRRFRSVADVARFVAPGAAPGIKLARQIEAVAVDPRTGAAKRTATTREAQSLGPLAGGGDLQRAGPLAPLVAQTTLAHEVMAGLSMPGDFFKSLEEAETNYIEAGKEIAARVKIPFADSWAGKVVGETLQVLWTPFAEVVNAGGYAASAAFPGIWGEAEEEASLGNWWRDTKDIFWGRANEYETLAGLGIPTWVVATMELAAARFDPVNIAFGLSSSARAARTTFGLTERVPFLTLTRAGMARAAVIGSRADMVNDFLYKPIARLGRARNKTVAEYLVGEARLAEDAERYYSRAVRAFRARFSTEGIHPIVASRIFTYVKNARKLGLSEKELVEGVNTVLLTAMGVTPPPGSLAARIGSHVEEVQAQAAYQLPLILSDGSAYVAPTTKLTRDAEKALGVLEDSVGDLARGQWRMIEVPHLGSPATRAEIALSTSKLADTGLGKTLRSTFQQLPKSRGYRYEIGVEEGTQAVRDFERGLRGYKSLSTQELAEARLQFGSAMESANPFREQLLVRTAQVWERRALERINLRYGISEQQSTRILDMLDRRLGRPSDEAFAVFREGGAETIERLPILSRTQQANYLQLVDPYVYRQGVSELIGTWRKYNRAAFSALGHPLPGAPRAAILPLRKFIDRFFDVTVGGFLSVFKPLVVLRPAYILRVVGIEEMGRFLGTLGLQRRLESGKILSGARVAGGEGRIAAAVEERARFTISTPELAAAGGASEIEFLRPGFLPDDPLFSTAMSHYAATSPVGMDRVLADALSPSRWGAVERTDPERFLPAWYDDLYMQFGLDPLGRRYLGDIARGVDEESSVRSAMTWLTSPGDGLAEARALMGGSFTREALEVQVRKGVRYANDLTGGSSRLAEAAVKRELTLDILNAVPLEQRPLVVHGPLASEAMLAKQGAIKRFIAAWGKWILQEPTNRITRQPFGKAWSERVFRSLVLTAREGNIPLTPKLLEGFQSTAKRFAAEQSQRIMFDFSRTGRLDSLTRHFLIFVQPFLEFPVAWSRVIRQNPATLWHIVRGGRIALDSGFVKTNPETGELEIPLTWWAAAAPLLAAITGGRLSKDATGGWGLSAPLTSFNLFAQSTIQLPTGEFAGEVPIPLPSFNPEALFGFQQLLEATPIKADVKARLASWLFAYGGLDPSRPANMLPAYMRHTLTGLFPDWFANESNLQTTHFMQLQQAMGLPVDAEAAAGQSREFSFMRAFFSLVFPAAPRISFPTQQLEDEWQRIYETSGDYGKARETFLEAHPGLDLIVTSRTMWAEENDSPVPIPPSQAVNELLNGKGAKQFAKDHPQWIWAIIPTELRDGTFDPGAFFSQIASGQRVALDPSQFETKAAVQRGWDAYFALREGHLAWQEAHPDIGLGDPSYEDENLDYNAMLNKLKLTNPEWANEYNTFELGGTDPKVMGEARRLAADNLFTQTDAGQGLVEYFALRDPIERELAKLGSHSILTVAAENAGLARRYNRGVNEIQRRHPDFKTAYRLFFSSDLQHVKTTAEKALDKLPEGLFDERLTPWWETFEDLRAAPNEAQLEGPRSDAYTALRIYVNQAFAEYPKGQNPMILRWRLADPSYRSDMVVSLLGRPYPYLSLFEKNIMLGDKSNRKTEDLWTLWAQARSAIAEREAYDPQYGSGDAYERLEHTVAGWAAQNETFRNQVIAASKWDSTFRKVLDNREVAVSLFGAELDSESRTHWDAFLDAVDQIQRVVDAAKLADPAGTRYDPKSKVAYNVLRAKLVDYANALRQSSPEFKAQWDFLEEASGPDPGVSYFMPEFDSYYGPLWGYPGD